MATANEYAQDTLDKNVPDVEASTYDATTREINAPTDTVKGQMEGLLSNDSEYMRINAAKGERKAQSRGLLNSSMAVGAARGAAIDAALPIAQQDASLYTTQALANQDAMNTAAGKNADALSTASAKNAANALSEHNTAMNTLSASDIQAQADAEQAKRLATTEAGLNTRLTETEAGKNTRQTEDIAAQKSMQTEKLLSNENINAANITSAEKMKADQIVSDEIMNKDRITSNETMNTAKIAADAVLQDQRIASDDRMRFTAFFDTRTNTNDSLIETLRNNPDLTDAEVKSRIAEANESYTSDIQLVADLYTIPLVFS